ncbi:hypothetical protein XFF7766_280009 [Xanthomonas citri pv. fuscans]|nr:hypothetical protein XFF7766_280009 [Xanthomonas citri pv. fuscans]
MYIEAFIIDDSISRYTKAGEHG